MKKKLKLSKKVITTLNLAEMSKIWGQNGDVITYGTPCTTGQFSIECTATGCPSTTVECG